MRTALRIAALVAILAALIVAPQYLRNYGIYLLSLWSLFAIAAMGLNLTLGYAGQMSLAQAAFLGIGAYAVALLVKAGVPFWVGVPLATLVAFAVGLLLGFPALRVQHHYLAFATLGFNVLVYLAIRNEDWLTGGSMGIGQVMGFAGMPRPSIFGYSLRRGIDFYYLCLAMLCLSTLLVWLLLRSPWGRAFAALRDNPVRAESLAIDIRAYTLLAFAIGAGLAGFAGAFYAPLVQLFDPSPFGLLESLSLLLMVVVGGSGRFWGPHIGAALVLLLPHWLQALLPAWLGPPDQWYLFVFGIAVLVLLTWCPGGLLAIPDRLRARAQ
ncbi:MAG: branched-chain amino acid ABC transporter permease [Alphaproteobacteria bacterium]|nr:branched-chain amino acid ABC transporter permease [Alphaproteobacteria bacterium]